MPPSISRAGAGACTTMPVQDRQASFGRLVTITQNCAVTDPVDPPIRPERHVRNPFIAAEPEFLLQSSFDLPELDLRALAYGAIVDQNR
jgi:hypothetical protein